jgi:hypothetical protein
LILDARRGTTDPTDLQSLAEAAQALHVQLSAEQAQAELGSVLDAYRG